MALVPNLGSHHGGLRGGGVLAVAVVVLLASSPSGAATRFWMPQGDSENWHDPANWSPAGVPTTGDEVIHNNAARPTVLTGGDTAFLSRLLLSIGGRLSTAGHAVVVHENGETALLQIQGTGSALVVQPGAALGRDADVDNLEVGFGGRLEMAGGIVHVDRTMTVDNASRITGHGLVRFNAQSVNDPPVVLELAGTLRPSGGTLQLVASADARILLDSDEDGATLDVAMGDLHIDARLRGNHVGMTTIAAGRTLTIDQEFSFDAAGMLHFTGGTPQEPATLDAAGSFINSLVNVEGTAVIGGNNRFLTTARVNLLDADSALRNAGQALIAGDILNEEEIGATFTGEGQVVNEAAGRLTMVNLPVIGVAVENAGVIDLALATFGGGADVGAVQLRRYGQTPQGTLQFDIGTLDGKNFPDVYDVDETATLDGTLDVNLVEFGSNPLPALALGDSFVILSAAGGVSGQFTTLTLPTPPADTSWRITYNANSVVLDLIAGALPGDYNRDGIVNTADYVLWRNTFGDTVPEGTAADGNSNGAVDGADYTVWRDNFGSAASVVTNGSATLAVPEPVTWLMCVIGVCTVAAHRRGTMLPP